MLHRWLKSILTPVIFQLRLPIYSEG